MNFGVPNWTCYYSASKNTVEGNVYISTSVEMNIEHCLFYINSLLSLTSDDYAARMPSRFSECQWCKRRLKVLTAPLSPVAKESKTMVNKNSTSATISNKWNKMLLQHYKYCEWHYRVVTSKFFSDASHINEQRWTI